MKKDRDLPPVTQTPRAPIHANIQFNKKNNITAYEWRSKIILIIQLNYTSHQHNIRNALLQTGLHNMTPTFQTAWSAMRTSRSGLLQSNLYYSS